MKPSLARSLACVTALAVVLADRLTKVLVEDFFLGAHGHGFAPPSIEVLGDALRLTYVRNPGMVFGLLSSSSFPYRDHLMSAVGAAAIAMLVVYFARVETRRRPLLYGLALVLGGAIGNLVDRVTAHYVVDFVDVSLYFARWPAFNLADSAIVVGVGLMMLDLMRKEAPEATPEGARG